jgi:hypothetical protein
VVTTRVYKPEAANTVWSSWWRAVCRSKYVEPSINFGIINSITRLHLIVLGCKGRAGRGRAVLRYEISLMVLERVLPVKCNF